MLWSFGLIILTMDMWRRMELGGIDIVQPPPMNSSVVDDDKNIVILLNNRNASEPDHIHVYSAKKFEKSQNKSIKPQLGMQWYDMTDLSKMLNAFDKQVGNVSSSLEKNIHKLAQVLDETHHPQNNKGKDEDKNNDQDFDYTVSPPPGDNYDVDNFEGEDDGEKILHSNVPINRVKQGTSQSHVA